MTKVNQELKKRGYRKTRNGKHYSHINTSYIYVKNGRYLNFDVEFHKNNFRKDFENLEELLEYLDKNFLL